VSHLNRTALHFFLCERLKDFLHNFSMMKPSRDAIAPAASEDSTIGERRRSTGMR